MCKNGDSREFAVKRRKKGAGSWKVRSSRGSFSTMEDTSRIQDSVGNQPGKMQGLEKEPLVSSGAGQQGPERPQDNHPLLKQDPEQNQTSLKAKSRSHSYLTRMGNSSFCF